MKTMQCKQLGGACDQEFHANTFEEVAKLSQKHGQEMYQKKDAAHLAAMREIQEMMKVPGEMERWQNEKRREFDALPED